MRSSEMLAMTRLAFFCILSILGGTSVAMDEPVASLPSSSSSSSSSSTWSSSSASSAAALHNPRFLPLIDPRNPILGGKRAYTYRSEYKRLPLYQFGLGKRWVQDVEDKRTQPFSFGLGKRTKQYSFGLGKRSSYDDSDGTRINFGYLPNELYDSYAQRDELENYLQKKRGHFNFGLGKRDAEMNDGEILDEGLHEKLPIKHSRDKYLFGLGKRVLFGEDEDEDSDLSAQLV